MSHPYPRHHPALPYRGQHRYFLTFCTHERARLFTTDLAVSIVTEQFRRAAARGGFVIDAYCFMPDHVHVVIAGSSDASDCRAFIRTAKQFAGHAFRQRFGRRLWQRYGFERVVRDDEEYAAVVSYVVTNPIRASLVERASDYPYLGSDCFSLPQLLAFCEVEGPNPLDAVADLPAKAGSHGDSSA